METRILDMAAREIAADLTPPPRVIRTLREGRRQLSLHLEWRGGTRRALLILDVDPSHSALHLAPLGRIPFDGSEAGPMDAIQGCFLVGLEMGVEPRIRCLRLRPPASANEESIEWTLVAEWTGNSGKILLVDAAGRVRDALPNADAVGGIYRPPAGRHLPALDDLGDEELSERLRDRPVSDWPRLLTRICRDLAIVVAVDAVIRGRSSLSVVLNLLRTPEFRSVGLYRFPHGAVLPIGETTRSVSSLGLSAAEVTDYALPALQSFLDPGDAVLMEILARRYDMQRQHTVRESRRSEMSRTIQAETGRLLRLRRHLLDERGAPDTGPRLRRSGEAILSHIHALRKGEARLVCPDWSDPTGQAEWTIELDPAKTPAENAQVYFHRARRWERGEPHRVKRLAEIERAAARLSIFEQRITDAENPPRETQFHDRLDEALGFLRRSSRDRPKTSSDRIRASSDHTRASSDHTRASSDHTRASSGRTEACADRTEAISELTRVPARRSSPLRTVNPVRRSSASREASSYHPRSFVTSEGWNVLVGRSNEENDYLTHRLAHPEDYWFHAHGVPGSHVVLRREGKKNNPNSRTLEEAASIAAFYSKARHSGKVSVIYTLKKYVRKPRGAKAGLAVCLREKSVLVSPRDPSEGREPEWMEE